MTVQGDHHNYIQTTHTAFNNLLLACTGTNLSLTCVYLRQAIQNSEIRVANGCHKPASVAHLEVDTTCTRISSVSSNLTVSLSSPIHPTKYSPKISWPGCLEYSSHSSYLEFVRLFLLSISSIAKRIASIKKHDHLG